MGRQHFSVMGYSVRTESWRHTVWLHWDGKNLVGDFGRPPVGIELYSHAGDKESNFDALKIRIWLMTPSIQMSSLHTTLWQWLTGRNLQAIPMEKEVALV